MQKTADEMRMSDWSSDVCSSDLAKDNNASCSLGPFIRLFDADFTMDDVRAAELDLEITGAEDGYRLAGHSSMREISRDPDDLVRQSLSAHHYPDGFVLFLGTLFARSEESSVGKEGVGTCRSGWSPSHKQK